MKKNVICTKNLRILHTFISIFIYNIVGVYIDTALYICVYLYMYLDTA